MVVIKQMKRIDKIFESDNQNPEIQALKKAMKETKDKRMYQRYKVIYLHLKGYSNLYIASLEGFDNHTVGIYVKNYTQNGINGLLIKKSPGAPRLLTKEQEAMLAEVITTQTPDQVGFPNRKNWYINIAQQWIKNTFDVEYSYRGTAEVLHRLNLSFTRPTYTLAKADPIKQEEFKVDFELLKKTCLTEKLTISSLKMNL